MKNLTKPLYRLPRIGKPQNPLPCFRQFPSLGGLTLLYCICHALLLVASPVRAAEELDVVIEDTPDYRWYAGCFGTSTGNLFGFWDRNGFPDFYTGPTGDGVAPLFDTGPNIGIRSMWASKAGFDGRPADQMGHIDDYWAWYLSEFNYSYENTAEDPYVMFNRPEHVPDCIGDFIGLSQKKWVNMNMECDGNIDAYSFVYWDGEGDPRINYTPSEDAGLPAVDIQSGLRDWTRYRGYDSDVFTQLVDFNPEVPAGKGFTFEDLKNEILSGYPLMVFLQQYGGFSRNMSNPSPMPVANPDIHAMLIYGFAEDDYGPLVRCRTSWASGDAWWRDWNSSSWVNFGSVFLSVRGVISYRPKPKITSINRANGQVSLTWDGPSVTVRDEISGQGRNIHSYIVERATRLDPHNFVQVTTSSTERTATFNESSTGPVYYRVKLLNPLDD